jgi:hypothetical protein
MSNRSPESEAWFDTYVNRQKALVQTVRALQLVAAWIESRA